MRAQQERGKRAAKKGVLHRAASALALGLALCAACGAPPAPSPSRLWTVRDLLDQSLAGKDPGASELAAQGAPLRWLAPPFAPPPALAAAQNGLVVQPAFGEGRPAAIVTTEVWRGFPRVWLQPLYRAVSAFDAQGPHLVAGSRPIFSVGDRSRFYSPYWQIIYFVLPAGRSADGFKSAKDVLDSGAELHEGRVTMCVLAPAEVAGLAAPAGAVPARPLSGEPVATPVPLTGYVDGEVVPFLHFGLNRFHWDEANVVEATALFVFAVRGPGGDPQRVDLPEVVGTGPLHGARPCGPADASGNLVCPDVVGGTPQFGSLWHRNAVLLPPGAGAFVPGTLPELAAHWRAQGLNVPAIDPAAEARADVKSFIGRVALNAAPSSDPARNCFLDATLKSCVWLDSQRAIEANVAQFALIDTDETVSCPLLFFNGQKVVIQ